MLNNLQLLTTAVHIDSWVQGLVALHALEGNRLSGALKMQLQSAFLTVQGEREDVFIMPFTATANANWHGRYRTWGAIARPLVKPLACKEAFLGIELSTIGKNSDHKDKQTKINKNKKNTEEAVRQQNRFG